MELSGMVRMVKERGPRHPDRLGLRMVPPHRLSLASLEQGDQADLEDQEVPVDRTDP